ncbi:MAG: sensor histidine kinase [Deltaproteobacteria bacterium]|nr:sensor histidine kinase [Deltaproteobacteria bacterium]
MKNKLAIKLGGVFLVTTLIPFIVFGIISVQRAKKAAEETIYVRSAQESTQAAGRVEDFIRSTGVILEAMANNVSQFGVEAWQLQSIIDSYVLHLDRFSYLRIVDANNRVLAETPRPTAYKEKLSNIADVEKMIDARGIFRSEMYIEDFQPYMSIVVDIPSTRKDKLFLQADLSLITIWDYVDNLFVDGSNNVYIVSEKGTLLAHSDPKFKADVFRGIGSARYPSVVSKEDVSPKVIISEGWDGEDSFLVGAPIPMLGWSLVITQPVQVTFRAVRQLTWTLVIAIAFFCISVVVIGYLSGNWLVITPINHLLAMTRAVGRGDFTKRVTTHRNDELGELAIAFGEMQDRLVDYQREIEINARTSFLARIAAGLVHDMKHPIAIISTMSKLLKTKINEEGFVDKYYGIVQKEVGNASTFLQNLNDLAKPSKTNIKKVNVSETLQRIAESLRFKAKDDEIHLSSDIPNGLVAELDQFLFERVVTNLAVNAIQAVGSNGHVKIAAQREAQMIMIQIEDDGPGIPGDRLDTLFNDFVTTKKNGLGLGLPIAKKFTEEMNGSISVQSDEGKGTTLTLRFTSVQDTSELA